MEGTFDLHQTKGAVFVDNWEYELTLHGPSGTQWWDKSVTGHRHMGGAAIEGRRSREANVDFKVNPDDD